LHDAGLGCTIEMSLLCMAAKWGSNILSFMSNKTRRILFHFGNADGEHVCTFLLQGSTDQTD
jgi:hypothetical protein